MEEAKPKDHYDILVERLESMSDITSRGVHKADGVLKHQTRDTLELAVRYQIMLVILNDTGLCNLVGSHFASAWSYSYWTIVEDARDPCGKDTDLSARSSCAP